MTNEHAISVLKMVEAHGSLTIKAKEMAIKALEQQSCQDAISRQSAIDAIEKMQMPIMRSEYAYDQFKFCGLGMAREILIDLPPVTPAPKMGRWEWNQYSNDPNIGNWHCSECRSITIWGVSKKDQNGVPLYKYCPNCGVKMQEESESCKGCPNICVMYEPDMKGCKDKMEVVEE